MGLDKPSPNATWARPPTRLPSPPIARSRDFHGYFLRWTMEKRPPARLAAKPLPRRSKPNLSFPASYPPPTPLSSALPPPTTAPANSAPLGGCATLGMAAALASSPLVHLTASRLRLPRPRVHAPASGGSRVVSPGWRPTVGWRVVRRCDRLRCLSNDGGGGEDGEKRGEEEATAAAASAEAPVGTAEELGSERTRSGNFSSSSTSSRVRCYG
jgi:hypothetical protein